MSGSTIKKMLSVAQVCTANAQGDEKSENYKYRLRHDRIVSMFNTFYDNQVDVISVKELRRCSKNEIDVWHPEDIVKEYTSRTSYCSTQFYPVKLYGTEGMDFYNPFYVCHLYNPRKLVVKNTKCYWLYNDVYGSETSKPHSGGAVIVSHFFFKNEDGTCSDKSFIVESWHFPIDEEQKIKLSSYKKEKFDEIRNRDFDGSCPLIVTGDFNTFQDKEECKEQCQNLFHNFKHVSENKILVDKNFNRIEDETVSWSFKPFPHDRCKIEHSLLDYIFLSNRNLSFQPTETLMIVDENPVQISDHLPLVQRFRS